VTEDTAGPEEQRDAAWVTVETPLPPAELLVFCREDVERLFRINSLLRFDEWSRIGEHDHRVRLRNLGNDRKLETALHVDRLPDGLRVVYGDGLKTSTTFKVVPADGGAQLVVTDDYSGTPVEQRRARTDEVDNSLIQWGHDLHRYLARWSRWSRYSPWRWYMNRIWLPMTPAGRRVVFALVVISAIEFIAFLAVLFIFVLELNRFIGL
jgi:hypothetical protein